MITFKELHDVVKHDISWSYHLYPHADFPADFSFWEVAVKVVNGDHVTRGCGNVAIVTWVLSELALSKDLLYFRNL